MHQRLSLSSWVCLSGRAPTFYSKIALLAKDNSEAMQHLDRLYLTLQASQRIAVPPFTVITAKLSCVEEALAPRVAALDEFAQRPNATAHSVVEAFLAERASANPNAVLPMAAGADGQAESENGGEPDASAVYRAIALEPFRKMAATVLGADLASKLGRLNAIAAGFDGGCVLSVRMLCEGGRHLSLKHPALARLFDLRSHLVEYFTWCLTADAEGVIPSRLRDYSIAGPLGGAGVSSNSKANTPLLTKLLKFELDSIDWLGSPGGLLDLKAARDGGKSSAKSTHPDDIYTVPEAVTGIGEFIHQLLVAMGASKHTAIGYTFQSWTRLYVDHLERARKLRTKALRLDHLDRCHDYFLMALRHFGQQLKARVYCAQPDLKTITGPLITDDDDPVASIKQWESNHEASLNLLHDFRGMFSAGGDAEGSSDDLLDIWTLPRRSERRDSHANATRAVDKSREKNRGGNKRQREEEDDGGVFTPTTPGSATWAHLWLSGGAELLISGRVWHIDNLAAKFKVTKNAVCWPVLLSARFGDNKLAHCEHVGKAGHSSLTSAAHRLSGFRPASLFADTSLWRYPTDKEKATLSAQRAKAQPGASKSSPEVGRGRARGRDGRGRRARGRDARGGRGQGFQQPSSPLGEETTA